LSYKSVLVFLDDGKSNADRAGAAISIAQSHGAHITGASLLTLRPEHVKINTSDKVAELESRKLARSLVNDFSEKCTTAGIDFEVGLTGLKMVVISAV